MPANFVALAIVVVAVMPGSIYTWAYERQASSFGVTLADRTLRFVAVSLMFHAVFAWPEYGLYRAAVAHHSFDAGQFALVWLTVLVLAIFPATCGTLVGGLYASRNSRNGWNRVRRFLSAEHEERVLRIALGKDPAPRAWDDLFTERPAIYVRACMTDGTWIAGRFADESYAAGYPNDADLYLEEAWEIDEQGVLGDRGLGYAVYLPAGKFVWLDIVPQEDGDEEVAHA